MSSMAVRDHEAFVADRFDTLADRFRSEVADDDVRLAAIRRAFGPSCGSTLLDLGCGRGRFAEALERDGATVIGMDLSAGMLGRAGLSRRVQGSATRLPFASSRFDGVFAVEVFEHLPAGGIDAAFAEMARVLKPGGRAVVIDKNAAAFDGKRPWLPSLLVKRIDEHRGLWMYPAGGPVRERWFWPGAFRRRMGRSFVDVRRDYLLTDAERARSLHRLYPAARRFVAWTGCKAGGAS